MQSIAPGGPAATAGLLVGDLIVEYGGTSVSDAAGFNRLVGASAPGDTVPIRVRRGGTGRTLEVVVGDRANAPGLVGQRAGLLRGRRRSEHRRGPGRRAAEVDQRPAVRSPDAQDVAGRRQRRRGALQLVRFLDAGRDPGPKRGIVAVPCVRPPCRLPTDGRATGHVKKRDRDHACKGARRGRSPRRCGRHHRLPAGGRSENRRGAGHVPPHALHARNTRCGPCERQRAAGRKARSSTTTIAWPDWHRSSPVTQQHGSHEPTGDGSCCSQH